MSHKTSADRAGTGRVSPTAPESKSLSAAVWEYIEAEPGFNDAVREGEAQIREGRFVRLSEVRRRR